MRQEDRIVHLEQENAALRAELAAVYARLKRLEQRLAKARHNSSQPPSRDGAARQRRRKRKASEKRSGGQMGHTGHTLLPAATPDEVLRHRPGACQVCQQVLEGIPGEVKEHHQVHDLPTMHLVVQEHQVEQVRCPACQQISTGTFPAGVNASAQDGPHVRALGVLSAPVSVGASGENRCTVGRSLGGSALRRNARCLGAPSRPYLGADDGSPRRAVDRQPTPAGG